MKKLLLYNSILCNSSILSIINFTLILDILLYSLYFILFAFYISCNLSYFILINIMSIYRFSLLSIEILTNPREARSAKTGQKSFSFSGSKRGNASGAAR